MLRELCMIPAGRHAVMNFADPKAVVRDVETTIGTGVDVVLPWSAVPGRPTRACRCSRAARDPMVKELKARAPLRGHPADEAGPLPRQAPGGVGMNLADRLAAAHGEPAPSLSIPATSGVPVPRPSVVAAVPPPPVDALARLKDRVGKALFERMGSRR